MLVNTYLQYTVGGKLIIIVQMSKLKKRFLGECTTTENPLDIDTSIKLLNLTTELFPLTSLYIIIGLL